MFDKKIYFPADYDSKAVLVKIRIRHIEKAVRNLPGSPLSAYF